MLKIKYKGADAKEAEGAYTPLLVKRTHQTLVPLPRNTLVASTYQAAHITRGKGGVLQLDVHETNPVQNDAGALKTQVKADIIGQMRAFLREERDQIDVCFGAVGVQPFAMLDGGLVAAIRTKTADSGRIAGPNTGYQLIRESKHLPQSISDVQNLYVSTEGAKPAFKSELIKNLKHTSRIEIGGDIFTAVVMPNTTGNPKTDVAPRLEIGIAAEVNPRKIVDKFAQQFDENNQIFWLHANSERQCAQALGMNDKTGTFHQDIDQNFDCIPRDLPDEKLPTNNLFCTRSVCGIATLLRGQH